MNYSELKTAIQDYTQNDETSFVSNIPLFIRFAEERILKSVQLSLFRKNATASAVSGNKYLACPTDFLAPYSLSYETTGGDKIFVEFKDVNFLQSAYPDDSTEAAPLYYAQFDVDNFLLAPTPDSSYVVELHYLYRPTSITAGSDSGTTWLSDNAEMALLYGSLLEAYIYMKGDQDVFEAYSLRFNESLEGIKRLGEAKETTDQYSSGMVIRPKT
jgi:hypothetical protein